MESDDYGQTDRVYHCIDAAEDVLIQQPPRKLTIVKQAEVVKMLQDMR
jgi:hypothetical protein